jgi:hypothetical protein
MHLSEGLLFLTIHVYIRYIWDKDDDSSISNAALMAGSREGMHDKGHALSAVDFVHATRSAA